jgi:hypothetical protein
MDSTKSCYDLFNLGLTCLSAEAWAAWAQAILTVAALLGGMWAQSRLQFREWNHQRHQNAETLAVITHWARNVVQHVDSEVSTLPKLYEVATKKVYVDIGELLKLERVLSDYPIASLPGALTKEALVAHGNLRQFVRNINDGIENHKTMDRDAHELWYNDTIHPPLLALDESVIAIDQLVAALSK